MLKLIISLFIVTQICVLAQQTSNNLVNDEVDLTTVKSEDKQIPAIDDKTPKEEPKLDDKGFGGDEKDIDNKIPNKDDKDFEPKEDSFGPKKDEKDKFPEDNLGEEAKDKLPDANQNKNDEKPGSPDKNSPEKGGFDDKNTKPNDFEPNFDLGNEHKKVNVKDKNGFEDEKEVKHNKDTDKEVDLGKGGDGAYGKEPSFNDKEGNGFGGNGKEGKDVSANDEIFDKLIEQIKGNYRSELESVPLADYQPFDHGRWGSVKLHSGVVNGLTNVERFGSVQVIPESESKKLLIGDIVVNNVEADYKANAKLFHRLSISNRDLKMSLKKAILTVRLLADNNEKKVILKDLELKNTEGFGVKSGKLFWPFNKLTDAIVKSQESVVKDIIKKEITQYMDKVVHNVQFDELFAKLF